ncbi:hypothetical protein [Paucilactobacillus wasatchensis]|uniref:Uncharacterized protein n=1 Tax=Paucilactobacillus wasatchensis TaxID=1335616 RepID=A0A0D1A582_9LACO|nr:hypothetical protein [Paucilactobacillus wasatchensis]KIS02867.1 hypothetical protein WDC_1543 [Paucilactobacillus wasatchensis]
MAKLLAHLTRDCEQSYQYVKGHAWLDNLAKADIVLLILLGTYDWLGSALKWYLVGWQRMFFALVLMDAFLLFERVLEYFATHF